jgi:nucleoside-diphosphate-sugar epimerase
MARFTIIGGRGFIGGHLAAHMAASGHDVAAPARGALPSRDAGHVVYCAGLTADFRSKPFETVAAHVSHLADVLSHVRPESFLYLSSTRVYGASGREDAPLTVIPANPSDLYNATKIAGEALCLAQPAATVRVARMSNVYGSGMGEDNFLAAIIREAVTGRLKLSTAFESEKDYVDVRDVVRAIERIALHGRHRIYNVASGRNVTHRALAERLTRLTGCILAIEPDAPRIRYPHIDTRRLAAEFDPADQWAPADLLARLPRLVSSASAMHALQELVS